MANNDDCDDTEADIHPGAQEERLRDAIRAHDDAAREATVARGDAKAARRGAKAAGQAFAQRH